MRVPVADLVGRPGASREHTTTVSREEVGGDPLGPAEDVLCWPVELELHLDSVVEGILVRGSLHYVAELPCARCLEPVEIERDLDVAELFQDPRRIGLDDEPPEEGYEILADGTMIDLETLFRDAILLDLPGRVVCPDGCEPIDTPEDVSLRSEDEHQHVLENTPDPRWAKLAELDIDQRTN